MGSADGRIAHNDIEAEGHLKPSRADNGTEAATMTNGRGWYDDESQWTNNGRPGPTPPVYIVYKRSKNTRKTAISAILGDLCRGMRAGMLARQGVAVS